MSEPSEEYEAALSRLAEALAEVEEYAVIGGLAVAFRGIPRTTRDIDVLLAVPRIQLPPVLERLAKTGFTLDVTDVLRELRDAHLSQIRYGPIRVDLMAAVLGMFVEIVKTARWEDLHGRRLRVASPEGLILLKLIAFRPQDQADIMGLLATNRGALDIDRIRTWYCQVGNADDDRWQALQRMLAEARR
jgi:predicted nucleotidyltransferase